ncbi:unnamed protein product, partial [marine sediment metagenome]
ADSDGSGRAVRKLRAGERIVLEPPVEPGAGARWVQLSGPDLLFRRGCAARARLAVRPRAAGSYRLAFLWDRGAVLSNSPVVELNVAGLTPVTAEVKGPPRAPAGEEVRLSSQGKVRGSCKVAEERWTWKQLSGPRLPFGREDRAKNCLRFVSELPGLYIFALRCSYDSRRSFWAVHTVEVPARADGTPERRPVARVASPPAAHVGKKVLLDGSRSVDPAGDDLVYRWTKVSGPPGEIVGEGTRVRFFPAFTGEYAFTLTVVDPA